MTKSSIREAIDAIAAGEFVIVVDFPDRENEGDLILAAERATPEKLAFMVRHTSGLICVPMTGQRLDELELPLMVARNTDSHNTAFTVSVDYLGGTTTGISAADRATTIRALTDQDTKPADLARPGHVFPLRYREGGVLVRPGHTEAAVDLARLAGLYPAGVLCEIVNDDGTMMRGRALEHFAMTHDIPMVSIAEMVEYLTGLDDHWLEDPVVKRVAEARLPTEYGVFKAIGYRSRLDGSEQVALVMGEIRGMDDVLVRVHSECFTGDVLGSLRCDCRSQLWEAQRQVAAEGAGVILYFRGHEGRGIGLMHKLAAYALQENGRDTVEANLELGLPVDARDYGVGAEILRDLEVSSVRLLTNNPTKQAGLEEYGIKVTERLPLPTSPTAQNRAYLEAKARKLGHDLDLEGTVDAAS